MRLSRRAPAIAHATGWFGANAGVATSHAVRNLLTDSILARAKSPVNF